mgnify:CR=1 FL=1
MQRKVSESPIGTDYWISLKDMDDYKLSILISVIRAIFPIRDSDDVLKFRIS